MPYEFDGDYAVAPCCAKAEHNRLLFQPLPSADALEGDWGILEGDNTETDNVCGEFSFCPYCGSKLPVITWQDYEDAGIELDADYKVCFTSLNFD